MMLIDTHAHLYLDDYKDDRDLMVRRALDEGVRYMLLPRIDSRTHQAMMSMAAQFPDSCLPMMGLHPTSVKEDWESELALVEEGLKSGSYCAVGEVGIDLYWDQTYRKEQEKVFVKEMEWSLMYGLPLVIHTRNSLEITIALIKDFNDRRLTGVFHCFPGTEEQAEEVIGMRFMLGIGGVVSYKNSQMSKVVEAIPLEHLVLETDAPFLSPHPKRGMRNESAFVAYVARKIAEIKNTGPEEVAGVTTDNALRLFPSINLRNPPPYGTPQRPLH